MIRTYLNAKLAMLIFIGATAVMTAGCSTTNINIDCNEGNSEAGGCTLKSYVGQVVNGQPCQSGSVCKTPGSTCDMSNPNAKCTNTINSGVCACKCQ
jgi:hypothetical protein